MQPGLPGCLMEAVCHSCGWQTQTWGCTEMGSILGVVRLGYANQVGWPGCGMLI